MFVAYDAKVQKWGLDIFGLVSTALPRWSRRVPVHPATGWRRDDLSVSSLLIYRYIEEERTFLVITMYPITATTRAISTIPHYSDYPGYISTISYYSDYPGYIYYIL